MSDSSEEEDLSRFKEVVDSTFINLITDSRDGRVGKTLEHGNPVKIKPTSERYLETAAHYNDVKVPEELQKQIGGKVSALIHRNVEFIDIGIVHVKKRKVKGGVKLFKDSENYLSCEDEKDNLTEIHNKKSKEIRSNKRKKNNEEEDVTEKEKLNSAVITGDYVLSKEETKFWKSRRKEKLYKYKPQGKSKVLVAIE